MSRIQHTVREAIGRYAIPTLLTVVVGLITGIGLGYRVLAPFFFE